MANIGFIVEAAFGAPVISTSALTWTNLSTRVVSFQIQSGRSDQLDNFDIGRLSIRFENNDGALNPSNTASPYYPNLNPRTPIRVRGYDQYYADLYGSSSAATSLFAGYTEAWNDDFVDRTIAYSDVTAYDVIGLLQQTNLSTSYPRQLSGSRVDAVMASLGISSGSTGFPRYVREVGKSSVAASTLTNTPALTHLRDCAIADGGLLYCAGSELLVYQDRHHDLLAATVRACLTNVPDSTYGDPCYYTTRTISYESIELRKQDVDIRNSITISLASSTRTSSVSDTASIVKYGERTYARSGTLHDSTVDAAAQAQWLLSRYKNPYHRIQSVSINPLVKYDRRRVPSLGNNSMLDTVLHAVLRDRWRVVHQYPGSTIVLDQYVFIEKVGHAYDARTGRFRTTLNFAPGQWEEYWALDVSTLSVLGLTTRLTY